MAAAIFSSLVTAGLWDQIPNLSPRAAQSVVERSRADFLCGLSGRRRPSSPRRNRNRGKARGIAGSEIKRFPHNETLLIDVAAKSRKENPARSGVHVS